MDQASPRTLLEQLVRASRRTIEENCAAFGRTAAGYGEQATLSPRQLWRWMVRDVTDARPVAQRVAYLHWGYDFNVLIGPPIPSSEVAVALPAADPAGDSPPPLSVVERVELLRQGVHDAISASALSEASLDEWDETVLRHGQATRYRPAGALLAELATDVAELQRVLERHHTATSLRRLTRTTAQLAGLMFLTLIKLNAPLAARHWARTARVAADEAGDPAIRCWVRAQEAYVHYYAGNLAEAIDVARQAQDLAGQTVCVGVPLAAALEARARAALRQDRTARQALTCAETSLGNLDATAQAPSAFGYNEAQLRFHEGNTLTHLHDTAGAIIAQDRALILYPASDFLDRTLLELDRATCLIYDHDATSAMAHATQTLLRLSDEQRRGLIVVRGHQLLDSLPGPERALPAARDLYDLLMAPEHQGDLPSC